MFGGVPTRVVVPPRMAPKASGMNRRDGARPARLAIEATAGINTAVAAMLFMNADRMPATTDHVGYAGLEQRSADYEHRQHGNDRG